MSGAIDAMRAHFNQAPIPKAKCLLDYRDRVNAMIDAIEAENAKLRDELDATKYDLSLFSERIVELGAENTKLRELVKDALPFFDDDMDVCVGGDCFAIGECCGSKSGDDCPAIRRMWERARELGVEVDE